MYICITIKHRNHSFVAFFKTHRVVDTDFHRFVVKFVITLRKCKNYANNYKTIPNYSMVSLRFQFIF